MRPVLLSVLTILWCATSVWIVSLAAALSTTLDLWHLEPENVLVFDAEEDMLMFLVVVVALAIVPVPFGLRFGRHWAWLAIQGAFLAIIGLFLLWGVEHFAGQPIAVTLRVGVNVLVMAFLWRYIRSDRVDAFCSVGRTVPVATIGRWATGGAVAGAVAGYAVAGIVDGEAVFRIAADGGVQGLVSPDFIEANLRLFAVALAASIGSAALCEIATRAALRPPTIRDGET